MTIPRLLFVLLGLVMGTLAAGVVIWYAFSKKLREAHIASQAKSAFLARISHELKTPLNAIVGYAEILRDGYKGKLGEEQRGVVAQVLTASQHLRDLIDQLLDFSKADAGKITFSASVFRADALVKAQLELARPVASEKNLKLKFEEPMGGVEMSSDEDKVTQILSNLIQNAVKFTQQGHVLVRLQEDRQAGLVLFCVEDTGPGIPPAELPHIFEPFRQGADPSRSASGGVGLGLAIVQEYVHALGGAVSVSSRPGQGSRFGVALPLAATRFMRRSEERLPAEQYLKRALS